jgi:hypothetical protein
MLHVEAVPMGPILRGFGDLRWNQRRGWPVLLLLKPLIDCQIRADPVVALGIIVIRRLIGGISEIRSGTRGVKRYTLLATGLHAVADIVTHGRRCGL